MIKKERLKELIDEGATVYYAKYRDASVYIKPLSLEKDFKAEFIYRNLMLDEEDLYEHKADAEWELEFGSVTKLKKMLPPPMFKDISINGKEKIIYRCDIGNGKQKYIIVDDNKMLLLYHNKQYFYKPFNEENYTEACRLIKKLFMGEG